MADPYLDLNGLKLRTIMPSADVDLIETDEPGWILTTLTDWSDEINSQLRKRYAVPFGDAGTGADAGKRVNVPSVVLRWLTAIMTRELYFKRGSSPTGDLDKEAILGKAEKAELAIQEAANSEKGLYDLPLKASETSTGISKGGPKAYSETSPFVWMDLQQATGTAEDGNGTGT